MTFEEVSKKYPLDCVMGDFYTYSLTEENLKFKLGFYDAWQYGEFFSFNRKDIRVKCILAAAIFLKKHMMKLIIALVDS